MNSTHPLPAVGLPPQPRTVAPSTAVAHDTLQSRFALRVASRLTEASETLSPDIAERLRHAREQALLRARSVRATQGDSPLSAGPRAGVLGSRVSGWRLRFATLIPVFALVGGLLLIQSWQDSAQVAVAAEIDAALLSDDLPPTAYSDAGFVEYLKTPGE